MLRVPFHSGRRSTGIEMSRSQARNSPELIEVLTWAGAGFFLVYMSVAAVLGFFSG